ncbi:hypothetical protein PR003_g28065 [Phytophthora rubi]|uniref:Retrotransposon gag domain-containing protein n=1 Tax=Phytophthora rubi TaxID=129364 RepID=A0A6A4BWV1_9STRA|nr:hypothetical protein PR003_g28065 [Phytophthora rubi]
MKAKVTTRVVRDVAGTGSNSGASEGKKGRPSHKKQLSPAASVGSRASPALRVAAASGGTGGARTQEMTVVGADAADDEGQTVGRHEEPSRKGQGDVGSGQREAAVHRAHRRATRRYRPTRTDGGGGRRVQYGDDASESSPSSATDDDVAPAATDSQARGRRAQRVTGQHAWSQRRSVKYLELPTFKLSPKASVSAWISRVDLALRWARESGKGNWSDRDLYFILGLKLLGMAARWWANQDRQLRDDQRSWTGLKKALLRRYYERLYKSTAEWRVTMRGMMPGETYADYAAALRELLVKQSPTPRALEEAVDKAADTDDQMDNVVKGMENISQSWATAPNPFPVPMAVTTGQTMVIPGVGNPDLAGYVAGEGGLMAGSDSAWVLFTNPRGVFNRCGRKAETSSTEAPKVKAEVCKKARVLVVQEDSGESTEEEEDEPAARKKSAGAVRQVVSERGREGKPADPASKCFLCCSGEH